MSLATRASDRPVLEGPATAGLPLPAGGPVVIEIPGVDPALASEQFLEVIPRDFARQHLIISQGRVAWRDESRDGHDHDHDDHDDHDDHALDRRPVERFAVAESSDPAAVHNLCVRLRVEPLVAVTSGESIARAVDEAYGASARALEANMQGLAGSAGTLAAALAGQPSDIERLVGEADRDLLSTQGKGPIVKLVDALLFEALGRSASDVHIHPLADHTLVRYRIDGVLQTARRVPRTLTQALTSRIKVMGKMDIAERRIAQDGRASVTIGGDGARGGAAGAGGAGGHVGGGGGGRAIDLRISTLPTSCGERVVIRLLDNTQHLGEFSQLGMPPDLASAFLQRASAASGMILLTGPTGSGKTTTLYATLRTIGSSEVNIMTIEDPIEYELSPAGGAGGAGGAAISQSQVNTRKGVTFATGLRHILRQDPDIVMVGEIRDGETARIAIQSSLTGHLVFSTLHTNDAASAITRLIDLGIEPYLVSASLSCALAQRLVRTYHQACGGAGCEECFASGFRGRTGLFELLLVDEKIRELISSRASLSAIRAAARACDPPMRTLSEDGQRLVDAGLTSLLEVQRVVQGSS